MLAFDLIITIIIISVVLFYISCGCSASFVWLPFHFCSCYFSVPVKLMDTYFSFNAFNALHFIVCVCVFSGTVILRLFVFRCIALYRLAISQLSSLWSVNFIRIICLQVASHREVESISYFHFILVPLYGWLLWITWIASVR